MDQLSIERIELLLVIAAFVALIARRAKLPYTVGLVIAGAVLASFGLLKGFVLTKELIFRALLPPLIFEAAFFIHWEELKSNLKPVLLFASVGVLLSSMIVAAAMVFGASWPIGTALVFGVLISATDPVSVIAMFKELGVTGRLRLLVEAESLLNDGVAAVVFSFALIFAMGQTLTFQAGSLLAIREVVGGAASGALVAGACLYLAGKTHDHLVELTFSTIGAFGSFLLAEHFHCSGVLAVLVAGLMIGNLGDMGAITDQGRQAVGAFWEFAAFLSNSIIFLLIGLQEQTMGQTLKSQLPVVFLAIAVTLVARAISVYGLSVFLRKGKDRVPKKCQHVLFWGGLRGALSLALALGLPQNFPFREQLLAASLGVVAFSVIVQGVTMPILLAKLKLSHRGSSEP